jgi:glycosyltransferase involved in cell wall biosynthesis
VKSKINQVAVAYLGKSGGGVAFFESVYFDLNEFGNILGILATDSEVKLPSSSRLVQVRTPHNIRELFDLRWITSSIMLTLKVFRLRISDVVFLMPQPIDYVISIFLRMCKIRVSYVIHDPSHHPGDSWPLYRSMKARFRISHKVFFLSSFVANHFKSLDLEKKSVITKLEARQHFSSASTNFTNQYGDYFLHVGRMKSYKGLERMLAVWEGIDNPEARLLIAGAGIKKSLINRRVPNNVIQIDRWLTEAEIWGLIENTKGLILLYEEATQSGVAAIALNLGVPILSTNVGGLKEQLRGASNALIVENNVLAIKQGLTEFGKLERITKSNLEMNSPMEVSLKIFKELCQTE